MVKTDFIKYCAKKAGFTNVAMKAALEAIVDSIIELVSIGEPVHINDFGEFFLKDCSARTARNVYTGEKMAVPAKKRPYFTPGKGFKQAIEEMQNNGRKEQWTIG